MGRWLNSPPESIWGKMMQGLKDRLVAQAVAEGFSSARVCRPWDVPDSTNVKAGAKAIKFHLDYMAWPLDRRRWLAGDRMTLADFAAAAHLSSLDYIQDVDWNRSATVKDWYAKIKSRPAFRSILADQVPGFLPPAHYADLDF